MEFDTAVNYCQVAANALKSFMNAKEALELAIAAKAMKEDIDKEIVQKQHELMSINQEIIQARINLEQSIVEGKKQYQAQYNLWVEGNKGEASKIEKELSELTSRHEAYLSKTQSDISANSETLRELTERIEEAEKRLAKATNALEKIQGML